MTQTKVAIVERTVLGVKAWHFRCLECGATGKGQGREATAVRQAKKHHCK